MEARGKRTSPASRRLFPVVGKGESQGGSRISVAQFNILASNLGLPNHFPYVQLDHLNWGTRYHTIINEIKELKVLSVGNDKPELVDILAMVELSNYWESFKDDLEAEGYNSVFLKRPSITASSWSGVNKYDGCGIFFQRIGNQTKIYLT